MQNKTERKQAFKMHTLICWNMHTITGLQNFHTYKYYKTQLDYIILPRKDQHTISFVLLFLLNIAVQLKIKSIFLKKVFFFFLHSLQVRV